jgi:hypothetical protein
VLRRNIDPFHILRVVQIPDKHRFLARCTKHRPFLVSAFMIESRAECNTVCGRHDPTEESQMSAREVTGVRPHVDVGRTRRSETSGPGTFMRSGAGARGAVYARLSAIDMYAVIIAIWSLASRSRRPLARTERMIEDHETLGELEVRPRMDTIDLEQRFGGS